MTTRLTVAVEPRYFRSSSIQSRFLATALRHTVKPLLGVWSHLPFDLFPPNVVDQAAGLFPAPMGTQSRRVSVGAAVAEWVTGDGVDEPNAVSGDSVILYLHGGAFITCGLNTHRGLVSRISSASGQPVLNLAYRQMPEVSITHAINDGIEAFRWLMDQGYSAGPHHRCRRLGWRLHGVQHRPRRHRRRLGTARRGRGHFAAARPQVRRQAGAPQRRSLRHVPALGSGALLQGRAAP